MASGAASPRGYGDPRPEFSRQGSEGVLGVDRIRPVWLLVPPAPLHWILEGLQCCEASPPPGAGWLTADGTTGHTWALVCLWELSSESRRPLCRYTEPGHGMGPQADVPHAGQEATHPQTLAKCGFAKGTTDGAAAHPPRAGDSPAKATAWKHPSTFYLQTDQTFINRSFLRRRQRPRYRLALGPHVQLAFRQFRTLKSNRLSRKGHRSEMFFSGCDERGNHTRASRTLPQGANSASEGTVGTRRPGLSSQGACRRERPSSKSQGTPTAVPQAGGSRRSQLLHSRTGEGEPGGHTQPRARESAHREGQLPLNATQLLPEGTTLHCFYG